MALPTFADYWSTIVIDGDVPSILNLVSACVFALCAVIAAIMWAAKRNWWSHGHMQRELSSAPSMILGGLTLTYLFAALRIGENAYVIPPLATPGYVRVYWIRWVANCILIPLTVLSIPTPLGGRTSEDVLVKIERALWSFFTPFLLAVLHIVPAGNPYRVVASIFAFVPWLILAIIMIYNFAQSSQKKYTALANQDDSAMRSDDVSEKGSKQDTTERRWYLAIALVFIITHIAYIVPVLIGHSVLISASPIVETILYMVIDVLSKVLVLFLLYFSK